MSSAYELVYRDKEKNLNVYAVEDRDPDVYSVWVDANESTVKRNPGESSACLWLRVLAEIQIQRHRSKGVAPFTAEVFAGVRPTAIHQIELKYVRLVRELWRDAHSGAKSPSARVRALCDLDEVLSWYPDMPWADAQRRRFAIRLAPPG